MKKLSLIAIASAFYWCAQAQHVEEWTAQKKTQKKYLLRQIAALQLYLGHLKDGYKLVGTGITTIHDLKDGEFHLHKNYFNSLKDVHPAVKTSKKVGEIMSYLEAIDSVLSKLIGDIKLERLLIASEKEHITMTVDNVVSECEKDMDELRLVITPGLVEMSDDQRLQRLEKLHRSMHEKYSFARAFCQKVYGTIVYRKRTLEEINTLRTLNDLKK